MNSYAVDLNMSATSAQPEVPAFVTELNANDVLFGRGAPAIENEGNVRFRQIVSSRKNEYLATSKRNIKDLIARQIIQAVAARGGRFLRKVESPVEAENIGVPSGVIAWVPVDEESILSKVKQALRDRDSEGESLADLRKRVNQEIGNVSSPTSAPAAGSLQSIPQVSAHFPSRAPSQSLGVDQLMVLQHHCNALFAQQLQQLQSNQAILSSSSEDSRLLASRNNLLHQQQYGGLQNWSLMPNQPAGARSLAPGLFPTLPSAPSPVSLGAGNQQQFSTLEDFLRMAQQQSRRNSEASSVHASELLAASRQAQVASPSQKINDSSLRRRKPLESQEKQDFTSGYAAITHALQKSTNASGNVSLLGMLELCQYEVLLLSVLCSHGLPVWVASQQESSFEAASGDDVFSWHQLAQTAFQVSKEWRRLDSSDANECACQFIRHAMKEPKELARKTIMLVSKLRSFLWEIPRGTTMESMKKKVPPIEPIDRWFDAELSRWGSTLEINTANGRPLAYSVSDFTLKMSKYAPEDAFAARAVLSNENALDIFSQMGLLSRLRSISLTRDSDQLSAMVKAASAAVPGWTRRPAWWSTDSTHDEVLLQMLVEHGFLGVTEHAGGFEHPLKHLNVTVAAVELRVVPLISQLHILDNMAVREDLFLDRIDQFILGLASSKRERVPPAHDSPKQLPFKRTKTSPGTPKTHL